MKSQDKYMKNHEQFERMWNKFMVDVEIFRKEQQDD